ncbi:MAG: C10 family peptidase [Massilibacteroides sp.]|nr:C10 family peptidase [Massilibacteroides sp.]
MYFNAIPEIIYGDLVAFYNKSTNKNPTMKSDVISYYAFLPTLWGQGAPYNSTVPYLCSNGRAPVGCVPVAIGQVMAYHGTPSNLDWTSILKSSVITSNSSQTVIDQVSNLLVEIGSRINISYACSGSGITGSQYETKVPQTLSSYGFVFTSPQNFSISAIAWSLSYSRPVLMNGWSTTVGHAWVCDAYKKHDYGNGEYYEYLNMNWGWAGDSNGFFYINNPPAFQTGSRIWSCIRIITDIRKF